ncbi:MAG: UbiA-like polyprenyltransferase [Pirellulales bacterium]
MSYVRRYLELIRFSHTVFALPFALLAAVMAWAASLGTNSSVGFGSHSSLDLSWREPLGIVLCMIFARSAAMAFNRLVDARIDAENPRTKSRHIPAGLLTSRGVAAFTLLSGVGFVASTLLFLPNRLPVILSIPVLLFLCGYSYAKRWTSLAHYWLGAALMLAPICAWIGLRGALVEQDPRDLLPAVVLGGVVFFWVGGFDILYACQDADFDRATGLRSIPARFGVAGALRIALVSHLVMLGLLALLPFVYPAFGALFWCGYVCVAALIVYQHSLVRPDDLSRVNQAFFTVNAILGIGLFVIGSIDAVF